MLHGCGLPSAVRVAVAVGAGAVRGACFGAGGGASSGGKMPLKEAMVSVAPAPARMRNQSTSQATNISPRMPSAEKIGDQSRSSPITNQRPVKTNAVTAEPYEMRLIISEDRITQVWVHRGRRARMDEWTTLATRRRMRETPA